MAVEIAFSNEMSKGIDPETAVLTSWLNKRILPKLSHWLHQSDNASPEQKLIFFFSFWLNTTMANFSQYIVLYWFNCSPQDYVH